MMIFTWGMAKLAMVRPETMSDLRRFRLYSGPHSRIGKMYLAPSIHFCFNGCPLNCLKGSSGKKVSLSLVLSLDMVLLWGGGTTLCTSMAMFMHWSWGCGKLLTLCSIGWANGLIGVCFVKWSCPVFMHFDEIIKYFLCDTTATLPYVTGQSISQPVERPPQNKLVISVRERVIWAHHRVPTSGHDRKKRFFAHMVFFFIFF